MGPVFYHYADLSANSQNMNQHSKNIYVETNKVKSIIVNNLTQIRSYIKSQFINIAIQT
jgi:hypothetical protein